MEWKDRAKELFAAGEKITAIAAAVGKTRQSVSLALKGAADYKELIRARREKAKAARHDYQKKWDAEKRVRPRREDTLYACVKRQHDIDVRVLSVERF